MTATRLTQATLFLATLCGGFLTQAGSTASDAAAQAAPVVTMPMVTVIGQRLPVVVMPQVMVTGKRPSQDLQFAQQARGPRG